MTFTSLSIDGIQRPINVAFPFYQHNPYPGNHRYQLEITFNNGMLAKKFMNRYGLNDSPTNYSLFFLAVSAQWPKSKNAASFFINSVDEVRLENNVLYLSGICSEIIK